MDIHNFYSNVLPVGAGDSAIFSEDLFRKRCPVLKKYVEGDPELQLQVIYGIQVTLAQKQHPKGMCFRAIIPTTRATDWACTVLIGNTVLSDVTLVTSILNVPNKNGYSYLNVFVHFGETSQTAAKNNLRLWIGIFQRIEDGSTPKANSSTRKRQTA